MAFTIAGFTQDEDGARYERLGVGMPYLGLFRKAVEMAEMIQECKRVAGELPDRPETDILYEQCGALLTSIQQEEEGFKLQEFPKEINDISRALCHIESLEAAIQRLEKQMKELQKLPVEGYRL
jgi:chaperonin cofactor prefoldin